MGLYKLPKLIGIDRKPSFGTRINWHHPLSQGLVGTWLFNERGRNLYNLALGGISSLDSIVYTWAEDSAKFLGVNYVDTNVISPFNWENTQPMSCAIGFKPVDFNSLYAFCGNGGAPGWTFGTSDGFNLLLQYWDSGSGVLKATSQGNSVVVNQWSHAVVTYNGNMHPSGCTFYANGRIKSTINEGDTLALSSISSRTFKIGTVGVYSWLLPHYIKYLYIYNRVLSIEEIISIYGNPYQMFWHPMRDIYIIPAAAPPPTGGRSIFGYDNIFHSGGIIQT